MDGGDATAPGKADEAKSMANNNKAAGENGVAVINGDLDGTEEA